MKEMEKCILSLEQCRTITTSISFIVMLIGIFELGGLFFNLFTFENAFSSWMGMPFNTTICFILSGFALWLLCEENVPWQSRFISRVSALIIVIVGAVGLAEFIFQADFSFNQIFLFDNQVRNIEFPGRMTFVTALNFTFIAVSLLLLDVNNQFKWIYQIFTCIILFITSISLMSYSVEIIVENYFEMTFATVITMILLSSAFFFARPNVGIIRIFLTDSISGRVGRRILLPIIISPAVAVTALNYGERYGLYSESFETILTLVVFITLLIMLLYVNILIISEEEKKSEKFKQELIESDSLFNEFTENIDVIFWRATPQLDKIIYVSHAYEKIWGQSIASLYQHPENWLNAVVPEDKLKVIDFFSKMKKNISKATAEYKILRSDGSIRDIYDRSFLQKDIDGTVLSVLGIATDMTEVYSSKIQVQLMRDISKALSMGHDINLVAKEVLSLICSALHYDIGEFWLLDKNETNLICMANLHRDPLLVMNIGSKKNNISDDTSENFQLICFHQEKVQYSTHPRHLVNKFKKINGESAELKECFGVPLRSQGEKIGVLIFYNCKLTNQSCDTYNFLINVTAHLSTYIQGIAVKKQLEYNEKYDLLTGLYNRSTFEEKLNILIESKPLCIAVVKLNISNLQIINDSIGYDTGNRVLQHLAKEFSDYLTKKVDTIALIGLGLFGFLMHKFEDISTVTNLVNDLFIITKKSVVINDVEIFMKANVGISCYPMNGKNSTALLGNAALALLESENEGGNSFKFATPGTESVLSRQVKIENAMHRALKNNEFEMYYQPKISLNSGIITSVEALIRWHDPTNGLRLPGEFISICENSDLIIEIGEWVLRKTIQDMLCDCTIIPIAVNLSIRQIQKTYSIAKIVQQLINKFNINPSYLEFEVTETMLMSDVKQTQQNLAELRSLGIAITVDDFGTGHSSFQYLKHFLPEAVKIDKSFVDGILTDQRSSEIIRVIIALSHSLKMKVIAEGVETADQVKFLINVDCDQIQGYYFSKPLPLHQIKALIESNVKYKIPV